MPVKTIKLKVPERLQAAFRDPESAVNKQFQAGIERSAITIQGEIKRNIVPGWGMGHKTRMPYFTGALNRSTTYQMKPLKAIIGANMKDYGAIQECGGTITPKTAKALFVPMSSRGRKVGPVKGGGSGLIYGKDFIFMQRVEIKPKHYIERGVDSAMPQVAAELENTVQKITGGMGFN